MGKIKDTDAYEEELIEYEEEDEKAPDSVTAKPGGDAVKKFLMEDVLANAKYSNFRLFGSDPFDPKKYINNVPSYSYSFEPPCFYLESNHDDQFFKDADPVTLFDHIQEAHHFRNKSLMDLTCQTLVSMVKRKSVTEIKTKFIINQDYDWINNRKPSQSITRRREKETFIAPLNVVYVQRSRLATETLSSIKRRKSNFNLFVANLLKFKSDEDLLAATRSLSYFVKDQVLADRLKPDHVVFLFNILEQFTSRQDIQSAVVGILSRVNFTAHEKALTAARIQLLVKVIDECNYAMTHLAVFTLTNIAKALPKFIVDILKCGALERVNSVLLARGRATGGMMNCIAMFLAAVCRTGDLSHLDKVDVALTTLQSLFEARAFRFRKHHIEEACHAFQYLTYGKELQIEEFELKKLIEELIGIIREPPRGNCPFPGYALGVIGNIAIWGSLDQIKILTSNSTILESLGMVMMASSKEIQKEACQIISNIAARMEGLIEKMHTAGLIELLCRLLEKDESLEKDEFDVKMEATWAIYNGIYGSKFPASRPSIMERE